MAPPSGDLAGALVGEARQICLMEAMAAYREALRFYTPEAAPLDYAMTQNNLGLALGYLAGALASSERQSRLEEAVAAYREALAFYTPRPPPFSTASSWAISSRLSRT